MCQRGEMKIKVDKEEYERLLEKVDYLEERLNRDRESMFENWRWTRETLEEMMELYFKHKCMTVMLKRDKDMIVGEVRKNAMDNLFKEREDVD